MTLANQDWKDHRVIVTGGAGFIGSVLVWELNRRGCCDIAIADFPALGDKQNNLAGLRYSEYLGPTLPVALAHVVAASDAEDRAALADHDYQFALKVHVGGVWRDDDRVAGVLQRADRLVEHLRTVRRLPVTQVALVIAAHRQNLGGLARIQQLHCAKRMRGASRLVRAEQIPANLADRCAIQNAVGRGGAGAVPDVLGHGCTSPCPPFGTPESTFGPAFGPSIFPLRASVTLALNIVSNTSLSF